MLFSRILHPPRTGRRTFQREPAFSQRIFSLETPLSQKAVEACWPPLTPEHGFPSQLFQGSGRSPSARSRPLRRLAATKNRRHHSGASCKKSFSYDFLRRHYPHQVKGRSLVTSSQPALRAPLCFVFRRVLYTRRGKKARISFSFAFLPNRFYNFPDYVILVPNSAAPGGAIPRFGALPGTKGD